MHTPNTHLRPFTPPSAPPPATKLRVSHLSWVTALREQGLSSSAAFVREYERAVAQRLSKTADSSEDGADSRGIRLLRYGGAQLTRRGSVGAGEGAEEEEAAMEGESAKADQLCLAQIAGSWIYACARYAA
eukprot:1696969-Rhodomonas_salina.1